MYHTEHKIVINPDYIPQFLIELYSSGLHFAYQDQTIYVWIDRKGANFKRFKEALGFCKAKAIVIKENF